MVLGKNRITRDGLELIKKFEGLRLYAYQDSVGVWTIGYGHTSRAGPPKVEPHMRITAEEAEQILRDDLRLFERFVRERVKVKLNDNQYSALVSFTFNLGPGNLSRSTLLRKVNERDFAGAAKEFKKWVRAGGKVLKGLEVRREAERELFERN